MFTQSGEHATQNLRRLGVSSGGMPTALGGHVRSVRGIESAMIDPVRQEVVALANTIVVKVGTNVLASADGLLERGRVQALVDQLARLRSSGKRVVLVSSGAIGAGVGRLGLSARPTDLRQLQACAAVGQNALMQLYQECLAPHGINAPPILLTAGDFDS